MSQIIIASHWHTGSTILAKMLNACGMEVGNENTYWTDDCIEQCEHALINQMGDNIYNLGSSTWLEEQTTRNILWSYIEESHYHNWGHYGIKATHILQDECWKFFKPIFNEVWPDAQYIVNIRHPLHIYLSTRDSVWPIERVIESFMSTVDATKELYNESVANGNVLIFNYPESCGWGVFQDLIADLNLTWNDTVYDLWDFERMHKQNINTSFFNECYPEVAKAYKELQSYVNV